MSHGLERENGTTWQPALAEVLAPSLGLLPVAELAAAMVLVPPDAWVVPPELTLETTLPWPPPPCPAVEEEEAPALATLPVRLLLSLVVPPEPPPPLSPWPPVDAGAPPDPVSLAK